jgi:beta-phosphoglucomutase-like phosphatase (HAD superfamily)
MHKLIIFDLDGVLIDSKEIHFNSLNLALKLVDPKYIISRAEQDSIYEGLTTSAKLQIMTRLKGLSPEFYDLIWKTKQQYSSDMFLSVNEDRELVSLFNFIKSHGIKIAVASNSIRTTLDNCLSALGLIDLVDYSLSNEDVENPKPNSEIYNRCIQRFNTTPEHVVIFEDSPVGREAAYGSKARVFEVNNRSDLTLSNISDMIEYLNGVVDE